MTYGELFAGIGGFGLGFKRAGMECEWQVEVNPQCAKMLGKHWPETELYLDVRECGKKNLKAVDVISGGFPCQDLSVAGDRAGLSGERSGLWFEFRRILEELTPRWLIIENVPGLLSSNGGRDFAIILRGLVKLGYGVAWRILDSQYFGVAQHRRRVFIVGSLGDYSCAEVLFESDGVSRYPEKIKKTRQVAPTLFASGTGTSRVASAGSEAEFCIVDGQDVATPILSSLAHGPCSNDTQTGRPSNLVCATLNSGGNDGGFRTEPGEHLAVWHENQSGEISFDDKAKTLRAGSSHSYQGVGVRRLTPTECERLQGFPDGFTAGQADTVRYRQLGNAVVSSISEWIGKRILKYEEINKI